MISRIRAGLGNQLFQYAAARAVALRLGVPLRLHPLFYAQDSLRSYRLDAYGLPARPALDRELRWVLTPLHGSPKVRALVEGVNRLLPFDRRWLVEESSMRFDPRIARLDHPVYLTGFWQCERYFDGHADTIRQELTLRTPVPECYKAVVDAIDGCQSVAIVVRRGDYLGIPNTQGLCTQDYYTRALDAITARVPQRRLFVFSDDIPWCRAHLIVEPGTTFVESATRHAPEEDLRLLSRCRHFILANSTFAWWGAWLSSNVEKLVVAPSRWMQDSEPYTDILPPQWLCVAAG